MVIAVASVAGWDGGIYVNEETKRPEKNPGSARSSPWPSSV